MEEYEERKTNEVTIVGRIVSGFTYDHEVRDEKFYNFNVATKRDSGKDDIIAVIVSERLINVRENHVNEYIYIRGQYRSYNRHEGYKNKLLLYLFALEVKITDAGAVNDLFLEGYLCKEPVYRETPLGRQITDILLAVNRAYGKTDYIPCICWGRLAYYVGSLNVGDCVRVAGRIQSREYTKNGETRVAYEVSVNLLERV